MESGGRNIARWTLEPGSRDGYRSAVDAALDYLKHYTTMAQLVTAYFKMDDPWLEADCRRPSVRILNVSNVEDRVLTPAGANGKERSS